MLERIHSLPYPWVFLFFWCLAMMRSHTMYWIGRGITAGTARSRWVSLLESPVYARAQAWSARWGVLAVPVSFLTVGIQSVIQLSAGVARMPLRHYVAATAAGAIAWAAVYTTIGMAILTAWLTGPTGRLICLLMLTALVLVVVIRRSRVMRGGQGGGRRERV
ncbi:VTT domain-containing protein [Actinomyces viscosus]|uniref:VTT domain-containing protein n=1 Tax=Actinomyces viscosus TaxID=1656 RepID=A0ABT7TUH0_ACTVI|nr:VTT domain-containing protein [Actinomyces viscosus]MDM8075475.1 VTT domain-containing protein [Actinomyces viscosus]